jgi:hypothetical protein
MTPDGSVLLGRIAFPALSYSKGGIGKKFNILEFFQLIGCNLRNFFSLNGLFHLRNLSMTPKP